MCPSCSNLGLYASFTISPRIPYQPQGGLCMDLSQPITVSRRIKYSDWLTWVTCPLQWHEGDGDGCHDFWSHQDHAGKHAGKNNYGFYGPLLCSSVMVLACIVYDQMPPVAPGRGHRYFHATLSKNVSQFGLLLRQTRGYRDFIWEMISVYSLGKSEWDKKEKKTNKRCVNKRRK